MPRIGLLWCILTAVLSAGCGSSRTYRVVVFPADATISIDGAPIGVGAAIVPLTIGGDVRHELVFSRVGYAERKVLVDSNLASDEIRVDLEHPKRQVQFTVSPLPAQIRVDGKPIGDGKATTSASTELEFIVDASNKWIPHVVTAERPGFRKAERIVNFNDATDTYALTLNIIQKTVTVTTEPSGAEILLDDKPQGKSPVTFTVQIDSDPLTSAWLSHKLSATKPGYDPAEIGLSWDNDQRDYTLKLGIRSKTIALTINPADALVKRGGKVLPHDPDGVVRTQLDYVPEANGELPIHELSIVPPASHPELDAATLKVAWDEGKTAYDVKLAPAPTRDMKLLRLTWAKKDGQLLASISEVKISAPPRTNERPGVAVTSVLGLPEGETIDSLATSADGRTLVYATLSTDAGGPKGRIWQRRADLPPAGTAVPKPISVTDGMSLAVMPSFAPDGQTILFAESRDKGRSFKTARVPIDGGAVARIAAAGEPSDLWPSLDSSPQARLYLQEAASTNVPAGQTVSGKLAVVELAEPPVRTALDVEGQQPRVSPLADAIVFTRPDARTGKRDLFLLPDGAKQAVNLTNSPDDDDFDPAWSKDGTRIAFASDRVEKRAASNPVNANAGEVARDYNLWAIEPAAPEKIARITTNAAWDDSPAWNGNGTRIYFRSNRGGVWGIWSVEVK